MPRKTIKKPAPRAVAKKAAGVAKPAPKPVLATPVAGAKPARAGFAIYVYWLIILFFVCATFYILGRGHDILSKGESHEVSMSSRAAELLASGKDKLLGGNVSGAVADMTAAIENDPNAALAYNYRGEAYMSEANYAAAEVDLNKAVELNPDSALALYDRALLNIQTGGLDAAMSDLKRALEAFEKRPDEVLSVRDIYSKRAQLNLWMKNWIEAVSDYSIALDLAGNRPSDEDLSGRADAYTALGSYDAALRDYIAAVTTISNTIRDVEDSAGRINMSRRAMTDLEKSAAIRVQVGDMVAAKADLEAAGTLANALNDNDTLQRIHTLLSGLSAPARVDAQPLEPAPAPEPTPEPVLEPAPAPAEMIATPEPAPEPAPEQ
jgi:tetratricopeptide (TPR) repeat protein